MQSIALDIHLKHINACIRDDAGEIEMQSKFKTEPEAMDRFLIHVDKENSKIVIEACSCWEFVYDYLTDAGYKVILANPCQIEKKKGRKTDKLDAKKLSKLLHANMIPEAYAPPRDVRDQRSLTRLKQSLTELRTEVKNKVNAILIRNGIVHGFSDVFGVAGIQYLRSIDLEMRDRYQMDTYLDTIRNINKQILDIAERIEEVEVHNPDIKIVRSHPGFDYYLSLLFIGEIGDNRRFQSFNKITAYAGLDPSISQSGDKCYKGHITKKGNKRLRWCLIQAAHVAVMHDSKYAKIFHKIKAKRNPNVAYVAVARKILKTLYYMLKNHSYYRPTKDRKAS
jgi:transposase